MRLPLTSIAACLSLTACGVGPSGSAPREFIVPTRGAALLGTGYDTHTEDFRSACVKSSADASRNYVYMGAPTASIEFARGMSYDELKASLGVQVAGKMNIDGLNVSGAAKFLAEAASTDLSTSLSFSNQIRGLYVALRDPVLTPAALDIAATADKNKIRTQCGDTYVDQIELGSQLLVNMRFDFSNRDIKTEFEAEIKLDMVGLFAIEGAVKSALEKYKKNVGVTISAYQVGGDASKLSRVFQDATGNTEAVLRCGIENLSECLKAMQGVIRYASSDTEGDFPSQLKNMRFDETSPVGPAFLSYNVKSYYNGGFPALYPEPGAVLQQAIVDARERLAERYDEQSKDLRRALFMRKMHLTEAQRERVFAVEQTLSRKNIPGIVRTAQTCYERPMDCVAAEEALALQPYDKSALQKELGFFDYCAVGLPRSETTKTVAAVRAFLKAGADVSCEDLETDAQHELELDLSGQQIRDLRPLGDLANLRILKADNNAIRNLQPLAKLPLLESLSVRRNDISNLAGVEKLANLKFLDVAYNRIIDLEPLRGLTALRTLKVQENPYADAEPVLGRPFDVLYLSLNHICDQERKWAFEKGFIDQSLLRVYEGANFAPVYNRDGDRNSGIAEFVRCNAAASVY